MHNIPNEDVDARDDDTQTTEAMSTQEEETQDDQNNIKTEDKTQQEQEQAPAPHRSMRTTTELDTFVSCKTFCMAGYKKAVSFPQHKE